MLKPGKRLLTAVLTAVLASVGVILTAPISNAATPTNQCSLPQAQRHGAWMCMAPASARAAAAAGWCDAGGCYERYDDFHVDFASRDAVFGYGSRTLGTEHHYVNWRITGQNIVANPAQFYTSIATNTLVFVGDLLNSAPGKVGSSIPGKYAAHPAGNAAAFQLVKWLPNGYLSRDNTAWDHTQSIEFTWKVAGYPGYWYTFVKSVCSHTTARNLSTTIYRFDAVNQVPAYAYGAGWHS